ncbi:DUF7144 family membrane protein [Nocardia veterana]|uniref:DUF7144 domain-containing protein n=1 Tax=Nocardia veterana TaxID=132249 RepID=A0A7X6RH88_9NOCA|nr:hypothetical protein [Nocardia veterana]NKY85279.1 hypothetical protein [Nocardia veterana]
MTATEHGTLDRRSGTRQAVAAGTSLAAAALLVVTGIVSALQGISAIAKDDIYVSGPQYIYKFDVTGWGWIHLVLGVLLVAAAIGLFTGATWGRVLAIILLGLSILANFLWLPYYPWWSILVIALDIVVIWAIATWDPRRV